MSRAEDEARVRRQIHPGAATAGQGGRAAGGGGHEEAAAQATPAALRRILSQERDVSHPGNVSKPCQRIAHTRGQFLLNYNYCRCKVLCGN